MKERMRILMVSAEIAPFAKTGGLGEVMAALPKALRELGHDVRVYTPLSGVIDRQRFNLEPLSEQFQTALTPSGIITYFYDSPIHFPPGGRMYFWRTGNAPYLAFNQAVITLLDTLNWIPEIIHAHDWPAGLIPEIIKNLPLSSPYKSIATVQTIHNSAYVAITNQMSLKKSRQDTGLAPIPDKTDICAIKRLNFLKRGILNADAVTTVSQQYSRELLKTQTSHGLAKYVRTQKSQFFGIRNGVDYSHWSPAQDPHLKVNYDIANIKDKMINKLEIQVSLGLPANPSVPVLAMNCRLEEQKGFKLVFEALDDIMRLGVQLIINGDGSPGHKRYLHRMMKRYPRQLVWRPYSAELGSLIYGGADILLLPSIFEPCGTGQMICMRYGTIPIARRTGGIVDTVIDYTSEIKESTGFLFSERNGRALLKAIKRALDIQKQPEQWSALIQRAMTASFIWEESAREYTRVYKSVIQRRPLLGDQADGARPGCPLPRSE